MTLVQASVWSYGTSLPDVKGEAQVTEERNHEARVPMRGTGMDRAVEAMKAGNAAGAKGVGLSGCIHSSTGDRGKPMSATKPFAIPKPRGGGCICLMGAVC